MTTLRNKFYVALVLFAILTTIWFVPIEQAISSDVTVYDESLSVITNIFCFNMDEYTLELSKYSADNPDDYGGRLQEDLTYSLQSKQSNVSVHLRFVDSKLLFVTTSVVNGTLDSAHYVESLSSNIIDATNTILQRLKTNTAAQYIEELQNSMNSVTNIDSINAIMGNLKRKITLNSDGTSASIHFMYTLNGADSPKGIVLRFNDGFLKGFTTGWDLYEIGSETVTVQENDAITIAKQQANNATNSKLSFGDSITTDFRLLPREPFTVYPFWFIEIPLNYPNSTITAWQLGIWADTGEIEYSHPTGTHGTIPTQDDSSAAQTEPEPNYSVYLAVIATATLFTIVGAVLIKKKYTT
ncbi:MAG: hypothetical protein NWF03_00320 [Candidatus Bathyarchaeota archaeon]|nr:hypothetical protein [Candidatus Bathyarchaeota archaeon]